MQGFAHCAEIPVGATPKVQRNEPSSRARDSGSGIRPRRRRCPLHCSRSSPSISRVFDRLPLGAGGTFHHFVGGHMAEEEEGREEDGEEGQEEEVGFAGMHRGRCFCRPRAFPYIAPRDPARRAAQPRPRGRRRSARLGRDPTLDIPFDPGRRHRQRRPRARLARSRRHVVAGGPRQHQRHLAGRAAHRRGGGAAHRRPLHPRPARAGAQGQPSPGEVARTQAAARRGRVAAAAPAAPRAGGEDLVAHGREIAARARRQPARSRCARSPTRSSPSATRSVAFDAAGAATISDLGSRTAPSSTASQVHASRAC